MTWVARSKSDKAKMRGLSVAELRTRKLRCGHATDAEPIAINQGRKFFRCPEGCGLQKAA